MTDDLDKLRESWKQKPPISGMPIEEIKKRVAAGIKNRRTQGRLRPAGLPNVDTGMKVGDETFQLQRGHRIALIQQTNLAIYALANGDMLDYCHAASTINAIRKQNGIPIEFMQKILKGVAVEAAEASGESFEMLDQLARAALHEHFQPSDKVISIGSRRKGDSNGSKETNGRDSTRPGERHKPEL